MTQAPKIEMMAIDGHLTFFADGRAFAKLTSLTFDTVGEHYADQEFLQKISALLFGDVMEAQMTRGSHLECSYSYEMLVNPKHKPRCTTLPSAETFLHLRRTLHGSIQSKEAVNHPAHYNQGTIEVIDAIEDWCLGFHEGNVVKYVARHRHKNGVEDLKKARWYLDRLIEQMEPKEGGNL